MIPSLLLCLMRISVSPSKPSRFLHTQKPVLFKHSELSSLPVCTKQACSKEGPAFQRGRNYRKQCASLSVGGHSSLCSLSQEGEQNPKSSLKLLCSDVSGHLHAAAAQGHGHVFVDDADGRKEKETSCLDQVHQLLLLH